jgi:hypothetical protein
MNEMIEPVGGSVVSYYPTEADALNFTNLLGYGNSYIVGDGGPFGGYTSWRLASNSNGSSPQNIVYINGDILNDDGSYFLYPSAPCFLEGTKILTDKEPFMEELSKYYFDFDESFNFLKELDVYDFDLSKDIYCTKIVPTYAEFRIGNEYGTADYVTISIIANKLTIACKWQGKSQEKPYLSNTIILRKLGNK